MRLPVPSSSSARKAFLSAPRRIRSGIGSNVPTSVGTTPAARCSCSRVIVATTVLQPRVGGIGPSRCSATFKAATSASWRRWSAVRESASFSPRWKQITRPGIIGEQPIKECPQLGSDIAFKRGHQVCLLRRDFNIPTALPFCIGWLRLRIEPLQDLHTSLTQIIWREHAGKPSQHFLHRSYRILRSPCRNLIEHLGNLHGGGHPKLGFGSLSTVAGCSNRLWASNTRSFSSRRPNLPLCITSLKLALTFGWNA